MAEQLPGTVLIVDDEAIIREMLSIELEGKYNVLTAENADGAFRILEEHKVDLLISDINMPGMKGFDLLKKVRENYPGTKTALITSYDIDDFIRLAKDNAVANIIPKSTPFNFDEFNTIVKNLVTEEIFGLEKQLQKDFEIVSEYKVISSKEIIKVENDIIENISKFHEPKTYVNVLLEELITNAVYHAPVDEEGREKYIKHSDITLEESEAVKIVLAKDREKYGVSVMDSSGKLTKDQVLYRIDRHIHGEGLLDENGRGIHMSRIYSDRLILNIRKDVATEAIFINYLDEKYKGFKPLYVNEI